MRDRFQWAHLDLGGGPNCILEFADMNIFASAGISPGFHSSSGDE